MKLTTPIGIAALTRTPTGRHAGALASWEAHELLAHTLRDVSLQTTADVDEVLIGCVRNGIGNVGRVAALAAGIGVDVPACTIDRQCASSLEALMVAAAKIASGMIKSALVGGVESASRCPWFMEKSARPYAYFEPTPYRIRLSSDDIGDPSMGETAEILADEFSISRESMDEFAYTSQSRAAKATQDGAFASEITALPARGKQPECSNDETIRDDTTREKLSQLPAVFRKDGRVTAGNSSPLSDGASACFVAGLDEFASLGFAPQVILRGINVAALDPKRMGMGPSLAIPRLLDSCGLKRSDIDLFEINEAFAAQVLAVNHELKLPGDRLNVNGGAIALGHPFGATGIRLIATLANALKQHDGKRGVASLCVGGGQGMAALIELA